MKVAIAAGLVLAAYFQSGPLFFMLALAVSLAILAQLWLREIVDHLYATRTMESHLFFGEQTTVAITFSNPGRLPVPWLELRESQPMALRVAQTCDKVLSIGARRQAGLTYTLVGRRRGVYSLGPMMVTVGDVFGLARRELCLPEPRSLIVYPRILGAQELELPALALFGDVRTRRRVVGDPARCGGIREYQPGDPLHDIHWRASAAAGSLQVKQYEPATTIQTMIYLDLEHAGYPMRDPWSAAELAISVAATVAHRLVELRQEVGLATNGQISLPARSAGNQIVQGLKTVETAVTAAPSTPASDQGDEDTSVTPAPLKPAKGRAQLIHVLELLARLELAESGPGLRRMLLQTTALPWGSTAVIVTGAADNALLAALHRLRETGLQVVLIVVTRQMASAEITGRARSLGVRLQYIWHDMPVLGAAV